METECRRNVELMWLYMAEDLLQWRKKSPYPMQEDWVFASPTMKGEQSYWPDNLMKR
jgi:hypothetical protein